MPFAEIVTSIVNEDDTDCDIDLMGKRLADEVKKKILREDFEKEEVIINFAGHSMGGIIARASLKYLEEYKGQFGFFCSLSSPHLGYLNGTDNMIKAGMWFMKKMMKQSKSLDQLSMTD